MSKSPPKLFLRFFRWFCRPDLLKPVEGDLIELYYERMDHSSRWRADWLFARDVLLLLRPSIIKPTDGTYRLTNYGMLKNYFKVGFRNILRNSTFSSLNITGLAVGLASCVLILIYVKNELSYDTYNKKYDDIYRVIHHFGYGRDIDSPEVIPTSEYSVWGNAPIGPALNAYFPQVKKVFQFSSPNPWLMEYKGRAFQEENIIFADSTAMEVFDWTLIAGDPKTFLIRPNTIVLTSALAIKLFHDENPVGKTVKMDNEIPFEVTGVIDIPDNSHFSFDGMISMSSFRRFRPEIFDSWGYVDFYTYFVLEERANIQDLQAATQSFLESREMYKSGYTIAYEPLADAYLRSDAARQPGTTGSLTNIYVFASVAVFILLIACINFMNLSTARSVERAKEVAIRKTIGSQRSSLIYQFLTEAILLTTIAAIIAGALVILGHTYLEYLSGKNLPVDWLFTTQYMGIALGSILTIGLLAGSYPAFILSGFKPNVVLKGVFKNSFQGVLLRKALVVVQFSLSIILLVGATVVYTQLEHLRKHELGFNPDQVLVVDYGWDPAVQQKMEFVKSQFLQHKDVLEVSASRATPGDFFPNAGTTIEDPTGESVSKSPALYEIDYDFIPTYQMKMVAGRNYSKDFPSDTAQSMILNESAARLFGYPNPEDIIGKSFEQWGRTGKVIGVVEDFNYVSLHSRVEPLALRHANRGTTSMLSLRLNSKDYGQTLRELEELWSTLAPHRPFVSHFNDDNFNKQYEADDRFGMIFTTFSILAIFVACLGLFGLTIYSTAQRAKEIGIRKVLGASTQSIIGILSKDFIKLFLIALIIGIPVSWLVMNDWLEGFAYRISIGWEVFAIASLITMTIAFVTMSLKTANAALSNPVDALRDE